MTVEKGFCCVLSLPPLLVCSAALGLLFPIDASSSQPPSACLSSDPHFRACSTIGRPFHGVLPLKLCPRGPSFIPPLQRGLLRRPLIPPPASKYKVPAASFLSLCSLQSRPCPSGKITVNKRQGISIMRPPPPPTHKDDKEELFVPASASALASCTVARGLGLSV